MMKSTKRQMFLSLMVFALLVLFAYAGEEEDSCEMEETPPTAEGLTWSGAWTTHLEDRIILYPAVSEPWSPLYDSVFIPIHTMGITDNDTQNDCCHWDGHLAAEWDLSNPAINAGFWMGPGVKVTHFDKEEPTNWGVIPVSDAAGFAPLTCTIWNYDSGNNNYGPCPYNEEEGEAIITTIKFIQVKVTGPDPYYTDIVGKGDVEADILPDELWPIPQFQNGQYIYDWKWGWGWHKHFYTNSPCLSLGDIQSVQPDFVGEDFMLSVYGNRGDSDSHLILMIKEFHMAGVDLDIDQVSEDNEDSVGGYIAINNDDDNINFQQDRYDNGPVAYENDLVSIFMVHRPPSVQYIGEVKLEAISGANKVKIWLDANKTTQVPLPQTWQLISNPFPWILYVEGYSASDHVCDVELRMSYLLDGVTIHYDKVKITVAEVDLDVEDVNEQEEENPGGFLGINDNDSNGNGTQDMNDTVLPYLVDDPDLVTVSLSILPVDLNSGIVSLNVPPNLKIWLDRKKNATQTQWDMSQTAFRSGTLYVEGYSVGEDNLTLSYDRTINSCQDKVKVTVVKTDLDIFGITDDQEEYPGGYVGVNNDDDNGNTIIDKFENYVFGENELLHIILDHDPSIVESMGYLVLDAPSGIDKIRIWTDWNKVNEIILPCIWDLSIDIFPHDLFVEGYASSENLRDIEVNLYYILDGLMIHKDIIKLTSIEVDLDVDSDNTNGLGNPDKN